MSDEEPGATPEPEAAAQIRTAVCHMETTKPGLEAATDAADFASTYGVTSVYGAELSGLMLRIRQFADVIDSDGGGGS